MEWFVSRTPWLCEDTDRDIATVRGVLEARGHTSHAMTDLSEYDRSRLRLGTLRDYMNYAFERIGNTDGTLCVINNREEGQGAIAEVSHGKALGKPTIAVQKRGNYAEFFESIADTTITYDDQEDLITKLEREMIRYPADVQGNPNLDSMGKERVTVLNGLHVRSMNPYNLGDCVEITDLPGTLDKNLASGMLFEKIQELSVRPEIDAVKVSEAQIIVGASAEIRELTFNVFPDGQHFPVDCIDEFMMSLGLDPRDSYYRDHIESRQGFGNGWMTTRLGQATLMRSQGFEGRMYGDQVYTLISPVSASG